MRPGKVKQLAQSQNGRFNPRLIDLKALLLNSLLKSHIRLHFVVDYKCRVITRIFLNYFKILLEMIK